MKALTQIQRHLLIGFAAIAFIVAAGYAIVANSDAYRAAQRYVTTQPKVIAVLGEDIETRLEWGGRFRVNLAEADRRMRLFVFATGRKASGTVTLELFKINNAGWVVEHAELSSPEGSIVLVQ
ncbi:MAG TPA: cytochrome c oxidase assembly factor Coa1 family protein [Burkholderiales bacterium]|nr:cytochrome c oxidase assembly factor Coa1 family protein [Burkholderiales bacterium]